MKCKDGLIMTWKKKLRVLLAALYAVVTAMSAAALLSLYIGGMVARAAGDPLAPVFTRENLARAFTPVLPVLIAAAVLTVVCLLTGRNGTKGTVSSAPLRKKPEPLPEGRRTSAVRIILICAAVILIVLGALNGGLRDVLVKAVNLCRECVGIG